MLLSSMYRSGAACPAPVVRMSAARVMFLSSQAASSTTLNRAPSSKKASSSSPGPGSKSGSRSGSKPGAEAEAEPEAGATSALKQRGGWFQPTLARSSSPSATASATASAGTKESTGATGTPAGNSSSQEHSLWIPSSSTPSSSSPSPAASPLLADTILKVPRKDFVIHPDTLAIHAAPHVVFAHAPKKATKKPVIHLMARSPRSPLPQTSTVLSRVRYVLGDKPPAFALQLTVSGNYPVHCNYFNARSRILTCIRNVSGDADQFRQFAATVCQVHPKKVLCHDKNASTFYIKGHHVAVLVEALQIAFAPPGRAAQVASPAQ